MVFQPVVKGAGLQKNLQKKCGFLVCVRLFVPNVPLILISQMSQNKPISHQWKGEGKARKSPTELFLSEVETQNLLWKQ